MLAEDAPATCQRTAHESRRGLLLLSHDLALGVPKSATVKHVALSEGCCWRVLIWPWMMETPQLPFPRKVLLESVDLDLGLDLVSSV